MSAPVQGSGSTITSVEKAISTTNGTFSHPNGITEQDVLEFLTVNELIEITLDLGLLVQAATVLVREKTDGTTYEIVQSGAFPADFDGDLVVFALNGKGRDMKVTLQSTIAEGAARNIPHARVEELRST